MPGGFLATGIMPGGFLATGICAGCLDVFTFNPETVPSVELAGTKHAICPDCVPEINAELERQGRTDRLTILPTSYAIEET